MIILLMDFVINMKIESNMNFQNKNFKMQRAKMETIPTPRLQVYFSFEFN